MVTRVHESWGPGPWDTEPDWLEFKAHGLRCKIARCSPPGHLCGYVEDRHNISDVGLPEEITGGKHGWLGFDCNHIVDANPERVARGLDTLDKYRTFDEVYDRTEDLALAVRRRGVWWRLLCRWLGRIFMRLAQEPTRWHQP